jgi:hypothetical protein
LLVFKRRPILWFYPRDGRQPKSLGKVKMQRRSGFHLADTRRTQLQARDIDLSFGSDIFSISKGPQTGLSAVRVRSSCRKIDGQLAPPYRASWLLRSMLHAHPWIISIAMAHAVSSWAYCVLSYAVAELWLQTLRCNNNLSAVSSQCRQSVPFSHPICHNLRWSSRRCPSSQQAGI